jgi:hypothetical protein
MEIYEYLKADGESDGVWSSVVDPDSLNSDPDPAFQVNRSGFRSKVLLTKN